jgi:hypothetical protein
MFALPGNHGVSSLGGVLFGEEGGKKGRTDVGAVEMGHEVEEGEDGDKAPVDLGLC